MTKRLTSITITEEGGHSLDIIRKDNPAFNLSAWVSLKLEEETKEAETPDKIIRSIESLIEQSEILKLKINANQEKLKIIQKMEKDKKIEMKEEEEKKKEKINLIKDNLINMAREKGFPEEDLYSMAKDYAENYSKFAGKDDWITIIEYLKMIGEKNGNK